MEQNDWVGQIDQEITELETSEEKKGIGETMYEEGCCLQCFKLYLY